MRIVLLLLAARIAACWALAVAIRRSLPDFRWEFRPGWAVTGYWCLSLAWHQMPPWHSGTNNKEKPMDKKYKLPNFPPASQ